MVAIIKVDNNHFIVPTSVVPFLAQMVLGIPYKLSENIFTFNIVYSSILVIHSFVLRM